MLAAAKSSALRTVTTTRLAHLSCRTFSSKPRRMERDYNAAVAALNTLQSNFAIVDAIRKSGKGMNKNAIPEMIDWCRRIGYEPSDFEKLNAIHVAGTKGKGSTSAFISSILCQYASHTSEKAPRKIGLYTSPHLRSVRERIQINSEPLSEPLFARYFFEVWDRLEASAEKLNLPVTSKPIYFRYLTLMAFHTYLSEGVDTAVIECGIGGEYDSTNILTAPTVCAVTSLGVDHTAVLGNTVEEIAWHKAGIFKRTTRSGKAFTVSTQLPSAMSVLKTRAAETNLILTAVPRHPEIESGAAPLGLAADFQKTNASLAVAVAAAHLSTLGVPLPADIDINTTLPAPFKQGLRQVQWGGRCETRREGPITWHLDGGHTLESIRLAAEWFATCLASAKKPQTRILLFNQQTRDAPALARALHEALKAALTPAVDDGATVPGSRNKEASPPLFTHAIFSTNVTYAAGAYKPDLLSINTSAEDVGALSVQQGLADTWRGLDGDVGVGEECQVFVQATVQEAIERIRGIAQEEEGEVVVLVTGSLHLVGGVLEVLETGAVGAN